MMKTVLKEGPIISIISASANNDVSHRDNHDGFEVFDHKPRFDNDEINLLYPQDEISRCDWKELEYATGFVPLYVNLWAKDPNTYYRQVRSEIDDALTNLRQETKKKDEESWKSVVKSAINCLLCMRLTELPNLLDRKYSLVEIDPVTDTCSIIALFPLVAEKYRDFFWDYLATYIDENERDILNVCTTATQAMRGCLLEQLVIRRPLKSKLADSDFRKIFTDAGLAKEIASTSKTAKEFTTVTRVPSCTRYPKLGSGEGNCTYFVPVAPNFPATDLIIHVGKIVIAFRLLFPLLTTMCSHHYKRRFQRQDGMKNRLKGLSWCIYVQRRTPQINWNRQLVNRRGVRIVFGRVVGSVNGCQRLIGISRSSIP